MSGMMWPMSVSLEVARTNKRRRASVELSPKNNEQKLQQKQIS